MIKEELDIINLIERYLTRNLLGKINYCNIKKLAEEIIKLLKEKEQK